MREKQNVIELLSLSPDYMGFIFYDKSSRFVKEPLKDISFGSTRKTGVFVDEDLPTLFQKATQYRLDSIQLHGNESPEYCSKIREKGYEVIKAFSIDKSFDFAQTLSYIQVADLFLFDAKGKLPGGNGVSFHWEKLNEYRGTKNFLLSGGISLKDVGQIKKLFHPQLIGIDVNSGFEISPGLKDISQLKEFFKQIKT